MVFLGSTGMYRRSFLSLLSATAWPLTARPQQPERMRRIGVLVGGTEGDPVEQARLAAVRQGSNGWDGRSSAMSALILALQPAAQIKFKRSRKSWSPCNPT
jgi:hypothetical protein